MIMWYAFVRKLTQPDTSGSHNIGLLSSLQVCKLTLGDVLLSQPIFGRSSISAVT